MGTIVVRDRKVAGLAVVVLEEAETGNADQVHANTQSRGDVSRAHLTQVDRVGSLTLARGPLAKILTQRATVIIRAGMVLSGSSLLPRR